ncbi:MAG: extracellular solute-binding protein [Patescibacteria group bacterium]
MNIRRRYVLIAAIVLVLGLLAYLVFANVQKRGILAEKVTLNVWGVDDEKVFESIASAYQALRPETEIIYKSIGLKTYWEELLNALAAGEGPDVFYIKNHDIPAEKDKLYPVDSTQFSPAQLNDLFPTVASQDLVYASGSQIYALPLYIDTLALLYNKDIFDQNAIVYPPKTWIEFQNLVPKLTNINQRGQILKSAAAIGGTEKTVDAGIDLLISLIMQNTSVEVRTDEENKALVNSLGSKSGADAFNFYLQFANPASTAYTWNDDQTNSLDSFGAGKTAMILNYQSAIPVIKNKSPFINIGIAPLPQIGGEKNAPVTYANYYSLAVSKLSKFPAQAWDFVIQTATNEGITRSYIASTGHPPALKTLIAEKVSDSDTSVFASSALIARSWYHANNREIRAALNDAIMDVLTGKSIARDALETAGDKINQLYYRR